jgi:hypothetical protein
MQNDKFKLTKEHKKYLLEESLISNDLISLGNLESNDFKDTYFKNPGIFFQYFNMKGRLIGYRLRHTAKVKDKDGKNLRYMQKKGAKLKAYFLKSHIPPILDVSIPLYITEGEKKLLSILSQKKMDIEAGISYPGCWGWTEKSSTEDQGLADPWTEIPYKGREIVLIPDSDFFTNYKVYSAIIPFINHLLTRGARINLVDLRGPDDGEKYGVDDYIKKFGIDKLVSKVGFPYWRFIDTKVDNYNKKYRNDFIKSLVLLPNDEAVEILDELNKTTKDFGVSTAKKLHKKSRYKWNKNKPLNLPQNTLVRFPNEDSYEQTNKKLNHYLQRIPSIYRNSKFNSFLYINELDESKIYTNSKELAELLSNYFSYRDAVRDPDGVPKIKQITHVPEAVLGSFLQLDKNFLNIKAINYSSHFPIVFKNNIISSKGHNKENGFYYLGSPLISVKKHTHINKIIDSFPFTSEVDKTNFLGFLLSLFFINEFKQEKPSLIVLGDEQNLGKTTLMIVLSVIFQNKVDTALLDLVDDNELKKIICSLLGSQNLIVFDNLKRKANNSTISSPFLERLITTPVIQERILGGNNIFKRINNFLIAFTINNGIFSKDILVRSLIISLSASQKHVMDMSLDIVKYTVEYRQEIVSELADMMENAIKSDYSGLAADIPVSDFKFKRWASTIANILKSLGYDNFLTNQDLLKSNADPLLKGLEEAIIEYDLIDKYLAAQKIIPFIPQEVFEGVGTPSGRITCLGQKLSLLNGKSFGSDKTIKVTKKMSGNNSTYLFSYITGSPGGTL